MSNKASKLIYDSEIERFETIGRTFASSVEYGLLVGDADSVQTLVDGVTTERGVLYAGVFNAWGKCIGSDSLPQPLVDIVTMKHQFGVAEEEGTTAYETVYDQIGEIRILVNDVVTEKPDNIQEIALFNEATSGDTEVVGHTVVIFSPQYVQAQINRERVISIISNATYVFLITLYVVFITSNFVSRIRMLITAMKRVQERDFSATVPVRSQDELSDLSSGFNTMVKDLESTTVSADELRAEQQRFLDIAAASGDWIWETDITGKFTYSNETAEKVLGFTAEELCGKYFYDFFLSDEKEKLKEQAFKLFSTQQIIKSFINRNIRKDGSIVVLETSGLPMFDEQGKCIGYRGTDRDITERIQAEENRKKLEMDLNQAKKLESIGTLAAGVAHEINTPVQFIGDNTQFLHDATTELFALLEKYRERVKEEHGEDVVAAIEAQHQISFFEQEVPQALTQTQEGVERVTKIVRAMKDFSHVGTEDLSLEDINKAVESTVAISRNEWKYVADVAVDLDPELPLVNCYIGEIKQVVLNLIINGAHAIREGVVQSEGKRGRITIATKQGGLGIVVEVRDTGRGIPREIQDKVFDPFFTTREVGVGTGQGLSLAYQTIVEKHHGKLYFASEEGLGTTFFIELPLNA